MYYWNPSPKEIRQEAMKLLAGKVLSRFGKEHLQQVEKMAALIRARQSRRGRSKFKITVCNHDFKPSEGKYCSYCYPNIYSINVPGKRIKKARLNNPKYDERYFG